MKMLRWMCSYSRNNRIRNEDIYNKVLDISCERMMFALVLICQI
uniref:Uncharacterized protein n=1 Tax=Rhizophora mucronata TaxID=61149 RepID=A0A2P2IH69_RHIMU